MISLPLTVSYNAPDIRKEKRGVRNDNSVIGLDIAKISFTVQFTAEIKFIKRTERDASLLCYLPNKLDRDRSGGGAHIGQEIDALGKKRHCPSGTR